MENTLYVKFLSPVQTYYNGKAKYVSSVNNVGPFSIFPGHAQFITLIEAAPIKIMDESNHERIFKDSTTIVLYSAANRVIIFSKSLTIEKEHK